MKKLMAMMMALLMLLTLAACGNDAAADDVPAITQGNDAQNETPNQDQDQADAQDQDAQAAVNGPYSFTYEGVELVPGEPFDPAKLPAASSVFEVPSCAIEGTDNVYNYETFEVTAFNDGSGEVIYSIFFIDPNLTTEEGLALGDDVAKMVELYGENYTQEGTAYIYTGESTLLSVIVQNDTVNSIEFRMIVE